LILFSLRYFNSRNRHAHKEYLLKFVIKQDCEDFASQMNQIMTLHSDLFLTDTDYSCQVEESTSNGHLSPLLTDKQIIQMAINDGKNSYPTNSSVIICHSDVLAEEQTSLLTTDSDKSHYQFSEDSLNSSSRVTEAEGGDGGNTTHQSILSDDTFSLNHTLPSNLFKKKKPTLKSPLYSKYSALSTSSLQSYLYKTPGQSMSAHQLFESNDKGPRLSSSNRYSTYSQSISNEDELNNNNNNSNNKNNNNTDETKSINTNTNTVNNSLFFNNSTAFSTDTKAKQLQTLLKSKKFKKSDISSPINFNHVMHLDKPVPIGKRYKLNYL
jgi:hypothetical protein